MVKKADIPGHIVDCAFELAAGEAWRRITLADIARESGVPLVDLYDNYPTKTAILNAYVDRIDRAMLAGIEPDLAEEPARDRLFDVIMRRFDAMTPQREGLRAIISETLFDPCLGLWGGCRLSRTLTLMLEAASLGAGGLRGIVRCKGLALVYLPTLRVWLNDDSEDTAKTMAALDRRLARLDDIAAGFGLRRREPPSEAAETA
jgi:AcrR family transcriptional regulator